MNRSLSALCLLPMLVVFSLCGQQTWAQNNTLRWGFEKGQQFKVEMTMEATQKMMMPGGGDMEIPVRQDVFMDWEVKDVQDGKFIMAQSITRMKMNMEAPMMQLQYDSDDEEASGMGAQLADVIKPIIGGEISFTMDARGNISDVEIPDDITSALESAGGGMGGQMFSKESLEQLVQSANLVFPENPVGEGESWSHEVTQSSPMGEMKMNNQYTYAGTVQKDGVTLHKINVKSQVELEGGEAPMGGTIEIDKADVSGEILFDNEKGQMVSSLAKQSMVMLMEMQGQEMEMEMSTNTQLKITQVK